MKYFLDAVIAAMVKTNYLVKATIDILIVIFFLPVSLWLNLLCLFKNKKDYNYDYD
jgi:hypothetical protein